MHHLKLIILGTIIGCVSGALVTGGWLLAGLTGLSSAIILFGVMNAALVGGVNSLRRFFTRMERCALGLSLSLATAALVVIAGRFHAESAVPLAIYLLALLNGILVAFAVHTITGDAGRLFG